MIFLISIGCFPGFGSNPHRWKVKLTIPVVTGILGWTQSRVHQWKKNPCLSWKKNSAWWRMFFYKKKPFNLKIKQRFVIDYHAENCQPFGLLETIHRHISKARLHGVHGHDWRRKLANTGQVRKNTEKVNKQNTVLNPYLVKQTYNIRMYIYIYKWKIYMYNYIIIHSWKNIIQLYK